MSSSSSSHSSAIGSIAPTLGQVLGATTAAAAGSQLLPRTGVGSWVFYLVIFSMIAAGLILVSFVGTRVVRYIVSLF